MKNIAVIGYGVIGKRVADAINLQDDMKLSGVCDIISDWRIQNAVRKEYDIYAATQEAEDRNEIRRYFSKRRYARPVEKIRSRCGLYP